MGSFLQDISYLGALQGVTAGPSDRNARVLAIVHSPIPCMESLVPKCSATVITVLRVMSAGYGVAPYTMPKKGQGPVAVKDGEKPEPLFTLNHNGDNGPTLNLWSYVSKGMNRYVNPV
jgi:hypothetical protein